MGQVQRVRTEIPGATLVDKWRHVLGALVENGVSRTAAPVLLSHLLLEHNRNFGAIYNWNVGNIKMWQDPAKYPGLNYYILTDNINSTDRYLAYNSLRAGLAPYVYEIKTRRPTVYAAADRQDIAAFCRGLYSTDPVTKVGGYIGVGWGGLEASINDAFRNINGLFRETRSLAPIVGFGIAAIGLVGLGVWLIARRRK